MEGVYEDILQCLMPSYHTGGFHSHSQQETQEMLEDAKKNFQGPDALEPSSEGIAVLKVQFI